MKTLIQLTNVRWVVLWVGSEGKTGFDLDTKKGRWKRGKYWQRQVDNMKYSNLALGLSRKLVTWAFWSHYQFLPDSISALAVVLPQINVLRVNWYFSDHMNDGSRPWRDRGHGKMLQGKKKSNWWQKYY